MNPVLQTHVLSSREASCIPFQEPQAVDKTLLQLREDEKPTASEISSTMKTPRQSEMKNVLIPDLFVSFVAQRPKPNPYYEVIKKESEAWMKQYGTINYLFRP